MKSVMTRAWVDMNYVLMFSLCTLGRSDIVQRCPLKPMTWMSRARIVKCNHQNGEFYHCYRNFDGELHERCKMTLQADPSRGCPYFVGNSDLGYLNCTEISGCPSENNSSYPTNELYKFDLSDQSGPKKLGSIAITVIVLGSLVAGNFCVIVAVVICVRRRSSRRLAHAKRKQTTPLTDGYHSRIRRTHTYDSIDEDKMQVSFRNSSDKIEPDLEVEDTKDAYENTWISHM